MTEDELLGALEDLLGLSAPAAMRAMNKWGVEACEGALLNTLTNMHDQGVRKPRAWFISTLNRGLQWKPNELRAYLRREWEKVIRRLEASEGVQEANVAKGLRSRAAWMASETAPGQEGPTEQPANVTSFRERA